MFRVFKMRIILHCFDCFLRHSSALAQVARAVWVEFLFCAFLLRNLATIYAFETVKEVALCSAVPAARSYPESSESMEIRACFVADAHVAVNTREFCPRNFISKFEKLCQTQLRIFLAI